MRDFDSSKLKDVYMTLTGFDRHLLGYVTFEELNETLMKYRVSLCVFAWLRSIQHVSYVTILLFNRCLLTSKAMILVKASVDTETKMYENVKVNGC